MSITGGSRNASVSIVTLEATDFKKACDQAPQITDQFPDVLRLYVPDFRGLIKCE
jgi:hypothetical protein